MDSNNTNGNSSDSGGNAAPVLLTVKDVGNMLQYSKRHVSRLLDDGLLPPPVRIGRSVRWRREDIYGWIARGCPPVWDQPIP